MVTVLDRFRRGLARTRRSVAAGLRATLGGGALDETRVAELERLLIEADVGVGVAERLIERLRHIRPGEGGLEQVLRDELVTMLGASSGPELPDTTPHVTLVAGVNGVGKTTTIGKLAHRKRVAGRRVLIGSCDTFRAAAGEQLDVWARRAGAELVRQPTGADPAAVAHDAVSAAVARGVDEVVLDTAGRLHTQSNLMAELAKVHRVIARRLPGAPHEVLLCLDATIGQNSIPQAREFHRTLGVTGLVLTKLDGTARGGVVVAITAELGIPVAFVGVGEGIEDLVPFEPAVFVEAFFDTGPNGGGDS